MFMFKFGVYGRPPFLCLLQQLNEVTKKSLMTCGFVRLCWNFNMMKLNCLEIDLSPVDAWLTCSKRFSLIFPYMKRLTLVPTRIWPFVKRKIKKNLRDQGNVWELINAKVTYCFEVRVFDEILCHTWVRPGLFTPWRKNYLSGGFLIFPQEKRDKNE